MVDILIYSGLHGMGVNLFLVFNGKCHILPAKCSSSQKLEESYFNNFLEGRNDHIAQAH